jgi:hypothetical protein
MGSTLGNPQTGDAGHVFRYAEAVSIKAISTELRGRMFSRTQNENGTYNTRCLHCFLTVASAVVSKEELDRIELRHLCPERVLAELLEQKKAAESAAAQQ